MFSSSERLLTFILLFVLSWFCAGVDLLDCSLDWTVFHDFCNTGEQFFSVESLSSSLQAFIQMKSN